MKKNAIFSLAVILVCLAALISCRSMQNGGGRDWASVKMSVARPASANKQGALLATSSSEITTVIFAVPASIDTVTDDTDLAEAYDNQLLDEVASTVTLKVPLNESLRLAARVYSGDLTLEQALAATPAYHGLSDAFTVDSDTASKTVTINTTGGGDLSLTGSWSFVDGDGANGINKDPSAGDGGQPRMVSYDCGYAACASENGLYATWTENNGSQWQIRVAKWDESSSWSFIDGDGANGINHNTANEARYPFILSYSSRLYIIWREQYGSGRFARAAKYKDSAWEFIDGNGNTGLAKETTEPEPYVDPKAMVFNNKLYAIWTETNGTASQVRVAEYDADGAATFAFVDGDGSVGINKNTIKDAQEPSLAAVDNQLLAIWHEKNNSDVPNIRVAKWDGSSNWGFVDGDGADGMNKNPLYQAGMPELIYTEASQEIGGLYAVWSEVNSGGINQIRVAKWGCGGECWEFIDGDGADGLNYNTSHYAYLPRVVEFNSKLYITWMEIPDGNPDNGSYVRVIQYDGSDWEFVDGNGTTGINRDSSKSAQVPSLAVHDSKLLASWMEMGSNGNYQVRVAVAETE